MNKLWAGRSEAETSALADAFQLFDRRRRTDVQTGYHRFMAHAAMLAKCGILA